MRFFSAAEMRDLDARTIAAGTSGHTLMGRAARGLTRELLAAEPRGTVLVLAGPGNNGGDGFGLALQLHRAGWPVQVWTAAEESRIQGDARTYLQSARAAGVPVTFKPDPSQWPQDAADLPWADLLVDALLGTGSAGTPRGPLAAAIRMLPLYAGSARVVAVDIPSGLNADSGEPFDPACCVRADRTLTLGAPKQGFLAPAVLAWTGSISVVDLGFLPDELAGQDGAVTCITARDALSACTRRDAYSHKGSFGHVLVIGGAPGLTGAAGMCALAALRSGAGKVSVLCPAACAPELDAAVPEVMVLPAPQGPERTLCPESWDLVRPRLKEFDSIVIGPGLRVNNDTETLIRTLLFDVDTPIIMDADAINAISGRTQWVYRTRASVALTPHPGELSRLIGVPIDRLQAERVRYAMETAQACDAVVAMKGAGTVVAEPGAPAAINLNGNPGMATAGSGDVLAGVIGALVARGLPMPDAVRAGVFLHGRAGDLAAAQIGTTGLLARDILHALPRAFRA